jgi:hypothetical protein
MIQMCSALYRSSIVHRRRITMAITSLGGFCPASQRVVLIRGLCMIMISIESSNSFHKTTFLQNFCNFFLQRPENLNIHMYNMYTTSWAPACSWHDGPGRERSWSYSMLRRDVSTIPSTLKTVTEFRKARGLLIQHAGTHTSLSFLLCYWPDHYSLQGCYCLRRTSRIARIISCISSIHNTDVVQ